MNQDRFSVVSCNFFVENVSGVVLEAFRKTFLRFFQNTISWRMLSMNSIAPLTLRKLKMKN